MDVANSSFCDACARVFSGNAEKVYYPSRYRNNEDVGMYLHYRHHDTWEVFQEAAKNGCKICSLVLSRLLTRIARQQEGDEVPVRLLQPQEGHLGLSCCFRQSYAQVPEQYMWKTLSFEYNTKRLLKTSVHPIGYFNARDSSKGRQAIF